MPWPPLALLQGPGGHLEGPFQQLLLCLTLADVCRAFAQNSYGPDAPSTWNKC